MDNELIEEIHNAEKTLKKCIPYYWYQAKECPSEIKLIMLINKWTSPVILCEELLKRIYSNELILRKRKIKFSEIGYKSNYRGLSNELQTEKNHCQDRLKEIKEQRK